MSSIKQLFIDAVLSDGVRKVLEKPLYSAGVSLYRLGVGIASVRNVKARQLWRGQRETWRKIKGAISTGDRVIWIHAASLGEFEQGRPLIEKIKRSYPDYKIMLTFFSPSGYEVRKNYSVADCVCYIPFDTPRRVRKFIGRVHPEMAIFVKYEFWRNYLHELYRRNIPTYLVSAVFRPDQLFFQPKGSWYRAWLKCFTRIFVQDSGSLELLEGIGVDYAEVAGDTRFDRVTDIMNARKRIPELESFVGSSEDGKKDFVMMFGSSWPEDESVYGDWLRQRKEVKAVIAPHEFDAARLEKLKGLVPGEVVLLSELRESAEAALGKRVLVIDCFGLLSSAYAYADVAYVGGGFGVSIHNINEAAVYGIPVMFGPENHKFIEAQELKALSGGIEVTGAESFSRNADRLLFDEVERKRRGHWAGEYISDKVGASDKILSKIFKKEMELAE